MSELSEREWSAPAPRRSTYGEILLSSALIGASSGATFLIGLVRAKAFALLLGPAGIGLIGLFNSVLDLARNLATMGIGSAGVRLVAADGGNPDHLARNARTIRWTALVLGIGGAVALAVFAEPIARATFSDAKQRSGVTLLSLAVLFGCIAAGQQAILQGQRRVKALALAGVVSAALGTLAALPLIWAWGDDAAAASVVAMAAASLATFWWLSRDIGRSHALAPPLAARLRDAAPLLKLGLAFMVSGLFVTGAAYAVRALLVQRLDLHAAGLYQAAWTVAGMYVGFVLQAMGTDFYPRLVACADDLAECNRLVNEQAEVSMVLALPGVIATIALAQPALSIVVSHQFDAAAGVLRWLCLGMAMRVFTWPMGFILTAQGCQRWFLAVDALWAVAATTFAWFAIPALGVDGSGIAFFAAYVLHAVVLYPLVRRLTGFRWTPGNLRRAGVALLAIGTAFCAFEVLSGTSATVVGCVIASVCAWYSALSLARLAPQGRGPRALLRLFRREPAVERPNA